MTGVTTTTFAIILNLIHVASFAQAISASAILDSHVSAVVGSESIGRFHAMG
jgi:hypothetical protein